MIVGIDLEGCKAEFALYSEKENRILYRSSLETKELVGEDVIFKISQHFEKLCKANKLQPSSIKAIGIGTIGKVFLETESLIVDDNQFEWHGFKIKKAVEKYFKQPVYITDGFRARTIGELWKGAAQDFSNFIYYGIGNGIGNGIVINQKIYSGAHNLASGFHQVISQKRDTSPLHESKNYLENETNLDSIVKTINDFADKNVDSALGKLKKSSGTFLHLKDLDSLIKNNDKDLFNILCKLMLNVSSHMSTMIYALDPQAIIIGGPITKFGDLGLRAFKYNLKKLTTPFFYNLLKIRFSFLGENSGVLGILYTVLCAYTDDITKQIGSVY